MTEKEKLAYQLECIQILEKAAHRFAVVIGKPLSLEERGKERFRYANPDSRHFQALKAVRVISGLYASMALLRVGHTQEVGVLLRTIQEFLEDIQFVQEAHETGQQTVHQQRIIDVFFDSDLKSTEEMLVDDSRVERIPRKKKVASQGRYFEPIENRERTRRVLDAIGNCLSGYVHGDYPQVMELYEANFDGGSERFRMRGMMGTPKVVPYRQNLGCYIHRSFNIFSVVAKVLGLNELSESLVEKRKEFEKTPAYKE
ncbi:MAG: hypothetical protein HYS22_05745 [Deltaproteobacteria bacterium]|nr:hypothetical protein [Deltaproteobacteria bacterium]